MPPDSAIETAAPAPSSYPHRIQNTVDFVARRQSEPLNAEDSERGRRMSDVSLRGELFLAYRMDDSHEIEAFIYPREL